MTDLLPAVVAEPTGKVNGAVVWLHGLGADGNDFVPVLPMLPLGALGIRVVLPHAPSMPVTINMGMTMPAWYDIRHGDLSVRHDEAGIRRSAERVVALLDDQRAQGVPAERIALVGFSQGGAMALHVGLRYPERLAGIAALSTYLLLEEVLDAEATQANSAQRIFQAHGTRDAVVDPARGAAAREALVARGHDVAWHDYPMGHEVCIPELQALGQWFEQVLGVG